MSIKVLAISNYRDYHTSRPEANIFLGLAQRGFDVHIMTYGDASYVEEFKHVGIKVVDFHPEKKFNKKEIHFIRNYIIDNEIDIIHLFNSPSIVNGIQASKGLPVKVVLYRGYSANIDWYDPTAYLKFLHPRVDKIFCNSIGVQQHIDRNTLFTSKKTITINKGHRVDWYSQYKPLGIREELGLPKDAFLLINVANNRRMKGIPYLLKAFNQIPADLPIHLLLVGNGMDTPQNKNIIAKGGKIANVHLLGFRKDVLEIVADCNVFTLSSIKGESITKSVIEAMSLECCPIITDIAGNVELVDNEENGLVVPMKNSKAMADAIMRVFNDPNWCQKMGKNAKLKIKNVLNTEQTIEKTQAMYLDLLNQ